ncbi:MAG: DUF1015 family protein [Acidimicrobiales bacterium]
MALLRPFRGLRYTPVAGPVEGLIAPPYDVVGPAERAHLAARNAHNAVHLELPEPDPAAGLDRYEAAAALLAAWRSQEVLRQDPVPALYPYRTTTPAGRRSTGVIGALTIGDDVLPHEQTLPKARSDRLDLLRATDANLSPIWALSLEPGLTAAFEPQGPPTTDAVDDDGVRHQLWVLDDPTAAEAVTRAVGGSPLVIADGHHRYETARAFRDERHDAGQGRPGDGAVMALVVELAPEQLHVGAIYRLVGGVAPGTDVPAALSRWLAVEPAGPVTEELVGRLSASGALAAVTAEGVWELGREPAVAGVTVGDGATGDPDLDVELLDRAIKDLPGAHVSYCARWEELLATVRSGEAQVGLLVPPVTVAQIAEWASAGRRMPPKTTYFVPKPRTGMVIRSLGTDLGPDPGPGTQAGATPG